MSEVPEMQSPEGDDEAVSRRDALKKGAMVGTAAFVVPVIGTMSMSKASAATPSDNPTGPGIGGLT